MRQIGVRELKASLSETLRAVDRGEQVRVTARGRPVADLVPAELEAGGRQLRQLVAEGRVSPATEALPAAAPELVAARSERSASALVLDERDEDR